jgi:hexosaminidase
LLAYPDYTPRSIIYQFSHDKHHFAIIKANHYQTGDIMTDRPFLWPIPQKLKIIPGQFQIKNHLMIFILNSSPEAIFFSIQRLQILLSHRKNKSWKIRVGQWKPAEHLGLIVQVIPEIFKTSQSYRLLIQPEYISLTAADPAGIFYGINTLIQIIQQNSEILPCLEINDYPNYTIRGVMLDISRDRVPTMETLFELVDLLASWKINQLQLYTEHTFAYSQHFPIWQNASPMTAEEILLLDQYCRARFVELVPNQNSFGHMHRWLKHPEYADLAEVKGWFDSPWGPMEGPFSLCPLLPDSLHLLTGLFDELLPNFQSRLFNVGCDETVDLGKGLSKAACDQRGAGQIYLDFLLQIHNEVSKRNHVMQFWGDIIFQHSALISDLPDNVIALEWGYEASHPFDEHGRQFAESGIPFYVCPGTSAWNSIAGRIDNALQNLRSAAKYGLVNGALGYLITDWGDNGHWQQLPISYPGYLVGAGVAWSSQSNGEVDVQKALNFFAFDDQAGSAGELMYSLGNIYKDIGITVHNASILFQILQTPLSAIKEDPLFSQYQVNKVLETIEASKHLLANCKFASSDGSKIADELAFTITMLEHACKRIVFANGQGKKEALLTGLDEVTREFKRLWLQRSRQGGLEDSLSRFKVIRDDYL